MKINAKVKPNSRKNEIICLGENYIIHVKEKAENNKANDAVIKLLSKKFNVDSKKIKIINPSSRKKTIILDV